VSQLNPRSNSDRNLLFGMLALQLDFISRDALIQALQAWVLDKRRPLDEILIDQGALAPDCNRLLQALVEKNLEQHQNNPEKSLAALKSVSSLAQELDDTGIVGLQTCLATAFHDGHTNIDPTPPTRDTVSAEMPKSAGTRFRILHQHAHGGLGEVFVALDQELHRKVALKQIRARHADEPESRARFLLEAEITGGLEHPGIVPVYSLGQDADGRPFYAMRFIKGESLREAIARFHRTDAGNWQQGDRLLEFRKLLSRFIDVCNAIAYAHSRGVLHRDLKPNNIMLGKYGETLVVDWGLAKVMGQSCDPEAGTFDSSPGDSSSYTFAGQALGTPAFMSPEQASGRLQELGPAADVYGLGATLYCVLTGSPPFRSQDTAEIQRSVQQRELPPPHRLKPQVPRALEAVCLKAMALKPEDRYPGARALADDIEHWLADEPVTACPEPWAVRARRWLRRHRALVMTAAATLVVAVISFAVAAVLLAGANQRLAAANRSEEAARAEATRDRDEARSQRDRAIRAEQEAKTNGTESERAAARANAVLGFFQDRVLAAARPKGQEGGLGKEATVRAALDAAEPEITRAFAGQPLTEAAIRYSLGRSYWHLTEMKLCQKQMERALELRSQTLGPDHLDVAASLNSLANVHWEQGEYTRAEPLHERALRIRQQKLGPNHPDVAQSLHNLALVYLKVGEYAKAEPLFQRSVKIVEDKLGPNHAKVAHYAQNLGKLYTATGDYARAEPLLKRSLKIREERFGPDHLDVADSQGGLAILYRCMGQYEKAEALTERSLKVQEELLGSDGPDMAYSLGLLADVYRDMARYDRALPLYRRSLEIRQTKLGKDHLDSLATLAEVGNCLLRQGKAADAEPLLRDCLARRQQKQPGCWTTFEVQALLGGALVSQHKYTEAEPLLLEGHQAMKDREAKIPVSERKRLSGTLDQIVHLYDVWGKPEQADLWRQKQHHAPTSPPRPNDKP
jgi:tetratricopeptide (TPR) repeat protein/tRNA A-37 threonylcarbamoyl transferase component Bud32